MGGERRVSYLVEIPFSSTMATMWSDFSWHPTAVGRALLVSRSGPENIDTLDALALLSRHQIREECNRGPESNLQNTVDSLKKSVPGLEIVTEALAMANDYGQQLVDQYPPMQLDSSDDSAVFQSLESDESTSEPETMAFEDRSDEDSFSSTLEGDIEMGDDDDELASEPIQIRPLSAVLPTVGTFVSKGSGRVEMTAFLRAATQLTAVKRQRTAQSTSQCLLATEADILFATAKVAGAWETAPSGKLLLSHGLRLPVKLGGPFGLSASGIELDEPYRVAGAGAPMPDLLEGASVHAFGPVVALSLATRPWLRALFPYAPGATSRFGAPMPRLEGEFASQWEGFRCEINGADVAVDDPNRHFDRLLSAAYCTVDSATQRRCSSKENTQDFLDSARHIVVFAPAKHASTSERGREIALCVAGALGSKTVPLLWQTVTYTGDDHSLYTASSAGNTKVALTLGGKRSWSGSRDVPLVHHFRFLL